MTQDQCRAEFDQWLLDNGFHYLLTHKSSKNLEIYSAMKSAYNAPRIASKDLVEKVAGAIANVTADPTWKEADNRTKIIILREAKAALRAAGFVVEGE